MRISTSTIYDMGVAGMQQATSDMVKTQQQIAAGRRILTPADDPVASARVLEVTQSQTLNLQYDTNIGSATSSLSMEDSILGSVSELITSVRTDAVSAQGPLLTDQARAGIAAALRGSYQQLLGLANSTDGNGQYLFSGYNGATRPFGDTSLGNMTYSGDQGQRLIQISPSRQLAVSDAGDDVFLRSKNGNGTIVSAAAAGNTGTGVVSTGNVLDPTKWAAVSPVLPVVPAGANANERFSTVFAVDNSVTPSVTTYDIVANIKLTLNPPAVAATTTVPAGTSLITGVATATQPNTSGSSGLRLPRIYNPGATVSLKQLATDGVAITASGQPAFSISSAWDAGVELSINGNPASGDTFTVQPTSNVDIFKTLGDLIAQLEKTIQGGAPTGTATQLANSINTAIQNFDQSQTSVLKVRASVGARMNEVDAAKVTGTDLQLQYTQTISNLQDLDYTKAATDLARQKAALEAAQLSFTKIQGLSLFNYIT